MTGKEFTTRYSWPFLLIVGITLSRSFGEAEINIEKFIDNVFRSIGIGIVTLTLAKTLVKTFRKVNKNEK